MDGILTFEQVSKAFGNVQALDSLSFKISKNKVIGLIGANGAGKTTVMRLITRYLLQDSGSIFFQDTLIRNLSNESFPISYIPDSPIYYEELSVFEHLMLISTMYHTQQHKETLINNLDLREHLDKVPSMLSKGNKQKLNIACALLRNYELLIADEPFSGLDPKQIKVLKDIILENKKLGKTVIISTHLLNMVDSLCDEYIMIDHGKLLAQGNIDQIVRNNAMCTSLEELYLYLSSQEANESI